jgi:hypothetical protein
MTNNTTVELGANPRVPGSATLINTITESTKPKGLTEESNTIEEMHERFLCTMEQQIDRLVGFYLESPLEKAELLDEVVNAFCVSTRDTHGTSQFQASQFWQMVDHRVEEILFLNGADQEFASAVKSQFPQALRASLEKVGSDWANQPISQL